jgi:iron complex outermembrane receptor protein
MNTRVFSVPGILHFPRSWSAVSRRIFFLAAAMACFFALIVPARAQGSGTGVIVGRVQNSATGNYLNNARVRVAGTNLEAFTNSAGEFRITGAPPGAATLNVFYTGMAPQQVSVTVPASGSVQKDVSLRGATDAATGAVVMSDYVVASQRETDAAAIAINEQRFAAARKDVVSTDAFGEINQGNIGEFIKFLPGISLDVKDGNTPSGIMVRGFDPNYTNVTLDGGQMASTIIANTQTSSRQFVLEGMNINNISRIEVVKLPTPDMQANVLGGAVNFITKSAFERARPEVRVSAYLSANAKALDFEKTPGPFQDKTFKVLPSFDFQYVNPVSRRFGYVVTAQRSSQYYLQNKSVVGYRFSGTANAAGVNPTRVPTLTDPIITNVNTSFAPNRSDRTSGGVTLDFKPWDHSVIKFNAQASLQKQQQSSRSLNYNVGGTTPLDWNQHNTMGASTGGSVGISTSFQERHALTRSLGGSWTFTKGDWEAELAGSYGNSNNRTRDMGKGFFRAISVTLPGVSKVDLQDIDSEEARFGTAAVYNSTGQRIDELKLANWRLTQANNATEPLNASDDTSEARLNISRRFYFRNIPFTVKAGGSINNTKRDLQYQPFGLNFVGPDGVQNSADDGLANYISQGDLGVSPGYGRPAPEWPDVFAIYRTLLDHPTWWQHTAAQAGDLVRNRAIRSPWFHETITSGYAMADTKLLNGDLRLVGGVRYELTEDEGRGFRQNGDAVYVKDSAGRVVYNVNPTTGARTPVIRPELGASGSGAYNEALYTYRGYYAARDYHFYHPSAAATYNIRDNLLLRVAFAKTVGRPNLSDIVPNLFVGENANFGVPGQSSSNVPGFITGANTNLKPWTAKNYDYSIEYYLPRNGIIMFNVFRKDIRDFFGSVSKIADQALLDELSVESSALGYQYTQRVNIGDARITGWEARFDYPLANLTSLGSFLTPIGESWARYFTLTTNHTHLDLQGSRITASDWKRYIPRSRNFGVRWGFPKFTGNVLLNWRGRMLRDTANSFPGANEYIRSRYQLDASAEYAITKRYSTFFAVRNLLNAKSEWEVSGPGAPSWATLTNSEDYGAQYSLGIRGTF